MENYCDYVPTPERIEASRRLDEERKERCKLINERYGIYEEENTEKNSEGKAKDGSSKDIKPGNNVFPNRGREIKEQKPKKEISRDKINNNTPSKDKDQTSLF